MLIGSLLAECGTGRAGDRCVAADLSGPLGLLIGKRNAEYAAGKKSLDVGNLKAHGSEADARSNSTKVPEMRLIIGLLGLLICIVSGRSKAVFEPPARHQSQVFLFPCLLQPRRILLLCP